MGSELKQKLESDWISILKSNLGANFNTVTYGKLIAHILAELEVQHLVLTRRTQLLTMNCQKNEQLRDFITRVEPMASVCQVEKGLSNE